MSIICFKCKQPIEEGQVINACGKTYHPSHFSCKGCGELLHNSDYQEIRKQPYCIGCATAMGMCRIQKCSRCGKDIYGQVIDIKGKKYHPDCFICDKCGIAFNGNKSYEKDGKIYCQSCYVSSEGLLCYVCGNIIEGKFKRVGDKKFHEGCFVCSVCGIPLNENFYCNNNTLYCNEHKFKLMGYKCGFCGEMIDRTDSNSIIACGRKWHADHFRCAECHNPLYETTARSYLDKVYCPICYDGIVVTHTINYK
ncbi:lim domain, putative [Entamoeba dispar SAW760]|uniref:Lim domain, putative n=1 Tax=Entamoeba dispar (strain ATCC PRA-260 / SAW760) TaxID=370354 RepID=B0EAS6_ENTDS|nr:lim domain, putative [Entamoeba dispar SAW760]EDR28365.1 lim domain, putative [Entamoeba dispar SAW760]|eukprot:EDR28365.1 lim domain, putative [Entamoeba dispar SAW760]